MKKSNTKILSSVSIFILIATMLFSAVSCGKKSSTDEEKPSGKVTIKVEVTDDKGEKKEFSITTEETTLRGALEKEELIEGEESTYGLYVKKVCGISADYDKDKAYWAFFKDGEYMTTSVDSETISDGTSYQIVYTKG